MVLVGEVGDILGSGGDLWPIDAGYFGVFLVGLVFVFEGFGELGEDEISAFLVAGLLVVGEPYQEDAISGGLAEVFGGVEAVGEVWPDASGVVFLGDAVADVLLDGSDHGG